MALRSAPVDRVAHLIDLGVKARDALGQIAPRCERLRLTWDIPELIEPRLPWRPIPPDPPPWEWQVPLLDPMILDDLVLGAQLEAVANLTGDADTEQKVARSLDSGRFDSVTTDAVTAAIDLLGDRLRGDAARLARLGPGRG